MKNAVSLFAQIGKTYWQHKKILLVFVLIQCAVDTALAVISRLFGDTLLSLVPDTQNLSQLQSFLLTLGFTVLSAAFTALWSSLFMLIPLSLIFSQEYPDAVPTRPFLLNSIPDILRIVGMLFVMQIIPTITTYVIPYWFYVAYDGDVPSYMDTLSYFLIIIAYLFSLALMLYFIPRQTAELAAEQQKESFAPLRPSILWFSYLMLIPIYVLRSLLSQLSFPLSLLATAFHQLQLVYFPILFYRALLPSTPFADKFDELNDAPDFDDTALIPEDDSIDIPQQKEE